jgi:UDP-N-acetylmuramoyl-L-alanine---L-glutamate ligase
LSTQIFRKENLGTLQACSLPSREHVSTALESLRIHRTAIWGFGREGRAALAAIRSSFPEKKVTLLLSAAEAQSWDFSTDANLELITAEVTSGILGQFGVVIKSPGISPYGKAIEWARFRGTRFISGSTLWFAAHPTARTICITGTKGKSSTSALVAHLLRGLGHVTALAGNIGVPLLELLNPEPMPEWWVIELSSYQTHDFLGVPAVAAVLNLYPEHLPWHGSEETYYADKLRILAGGKADVAVLNWQDKRLVEMTGFVERGYYFNSPDSWHVQDGHIYYAAERLFDLKKLRLQGLHNAHNVCAALMIVQAAGLDARAALAYLPSFHPLPHRMQVLGNSGGAEYIDDSIATTPHATVAALRAIDRACTVIVGGFDRGLSWECFVDHVQAQPPHAIVITGANSDVILQALQARLRVQNASAQSTPQPGHAALVVAADFNQAVDMAAKVTPRGGVVLLSPGAPSFDAFSSYAERGARFAQLAGFDVRAQGEIEGMGIR